MTTIIFRVTPTDYEAWYKGHVSEVENMKNASVTSDTIYRDRSDGKSIVLVQQVDDIDKMMAFFNSPELQKAIAEAPIEAPPEVWILDEVEQVF